MKKLRWAACGFALITIALWIGGWFFTWALSNLVGDRAKDLGPVGDMFGASSSLFAGLGALGVAVVLMVDISQRRDERRERQRHRRPVVFPRVDRISGARVSLASRISDFAQLQISISLKIENTSQEPALGVIIAVEEDSDFHVANTAQPEGPSTAKYDQDVNLVFAARGKAREYLTALSREEPVEIPLRISYRSLSGVSWVSCVTYLLSCPLPPDREVLLAVLDASNPFYVGERSRTSDSVQSVSLECTASTETWKQYEAQ